MTGIFSFLIGLPATDAPLITAALLAALPFIDTPSVPVVPLAVSGVAALVVVSYIAFRRGLGGQAYRLKMLSPERIAAHRHDGSEQSVEALAASIAERANAICQAVSEDSSDIRTEMCAIGYRRCANDMITLTHRINEESTASPLARRVRLRRLRKRAVDALSRARECLPADALKATRQET